MYLYLSCVIAYSLSLTLERNIPDAENARSRPVYETFCLFFINLPIPGSRNVTKQP